MAMKTAWKFIGLMVASVLVAKVVVWLIGYEVGAISLEVLIALILLERWARD